MSTDMHAAFISIATHGLPVSSSILANTLGSVPTMAMPYVMRLVLLNSVHNSPTVLMAAPRKNIPCKNGPPSSPATFMKVPSSHTPWSASTLNPITSEHMSMAMLAVMAYIML
eukprot:CAMPEP_0197608920 /NCGR_PEP_ID=MMETSP1326-20131121/50115_1 /TAXON_ID=1155430 /ORGANISM="Genus nov. species nov., Strain RCC2288" /LENGTH=112 /DNA_ID=CAMNT_0043177209 /DNA_START=1116 /DNA_END=1454 /DNA_ORIENTATION=+